jgi:hypothetical protein
MVLPCRLNVAFQFGSLDSLSGLLPSSLLLNLSALKCAVCIPNAFSGHSYLPAFRVPKPFEVKTRRMLSFRTISVHFKPFRINTCKSVSKQTTLSTFRINTYEKTGGWGEGTVAAPTPEGRNTC